MSSASSGSRGVLLQVFRGNIACGAKLVVPFVDYLDLARLYCEFKEGDAFFGHELRRYGAANQVWKLLSATQDILLRLNYPMLVATSFCLNWNYELPSMTVEADIYLVDLDLPDVLDGGSQVVLEGVRGNTQEHIDQTVVPHLCQ